MSNNDYVNKRQALIDGQKQPRQGFKYDRVEVKPTKQSFDWKPTDKENKPTDLSFEKLSKSGKENRIDIAKIKQREKQKAEQKLFQAANRAPKEVKHLRQTFNINCDLSARRAKP